jgi:RNA polymerase sigma factor (sigma-70 family)
MHSGWGARERGGDESQSLGRLEQVFEATRTRLFAYHLRMLGDEQEAVDALGDTACRLFGLCARGRVRLATPELCFAVASRVAHEALRRMRRDGRARSAVDDALPDRAPSVEEEVERAELLSAVRVAVASLPARLREVTVLRYSRQIDLSAEEIADALGLHRSTVHRRLRAAEELLARRLAPFRADGEGMR